MLMISSIKRIFISPYMTNVPLDCFTHMKCSLIRREKKKTVLFVMGKHFESKLLSRIMIFTCYLSYQLKLAGTQFFFCTKHHE